MGKRGRKPGSKNQPSGAKKPKIESAMANWLGVPENIAIAPTEEPAENEFQRKIPGHPPETSKPKTFRYSQKAPNIADLALSMAGGDEALATQRIFEAVESEILESIERGALVTPTKISSKYKLTIYESRQILDSFITDEENICRIDIFYRFVIQEPAKICVVIEEPGANLPPGKVLSKELFGFCKSGAKLGAMATYQPAPVTKQTAVNINYNHVQMLDLSVESHRKFPRSEKVHLFYKKKWNSLPRPFNPMSQFKYPEKSPDNNDTLDSMISQMNDETLKYDPTLPVRSPEDHLSSDTNPTSLDLSINSPDTIFVSNSSPESN